MTKTEKFKLWRGKPVTREKRDAWAAEMLADPRQLFQQSGDSLVVRIDLGDGDWEILDCKVRRIIASHHR